MHRSRGCAPGCWIVDPGGLGHPPQPDRQGQPIRHATGAGRHLPLQGDEGRGHLHGEHGHLCARRLSLRPPPAGQRHHGRWIAGLHPRPSQPGQVSKGPHRRPGALGQAARRGLGQPHLHLRLRRAHGERLFPVGAGPGHHPPGPVHQGTGRCGVQAGRRVKLVLDHLHPPPSELHRRPRSVGHLQGGQREDQHHAHLLPLEAQLLHHPGRGVQRRDGLCRGAAGGRPGRQGLLHGRAAAHGLGHNHLHRPTAAELL